MTKEYPGSNGHEFGGRSMHDNERESDDYDPLEGFDREPSIEDDIDAQKPPFLEDDWRLPGEARHADLYDDDSEELDHAA